MPHVLGTTLKIVCILNIDTATSAKITIKNPSDTTAVSAVDMTQEANKIYYYLWQSSEDNSYGTYEITIEVVYNTYTAVSQERVEMIDR